jgi:S1-C subfamily serine protease
MRGLALAVVALAVPVVALAQALPKSAQLGVPVAASAGAAQEVGGSLAEAPATARNVAAYRNRLQRVIDAERDRPRYRGVLEEKLFEAASPAVVLIVSLDRSGKPAGLGSGSILSRDGQILTNWHVVESAASIGVIFKPRGGADLDKAEVLPASLLKADSRRDLALIKLARPGKDLATITLGALTDVKVGSDVHAIGHPFGESWTYTKGVVSQIRRPAQWATNDSVAKHEALAVIQTQTPINPGNSGGPLLNDQMKLVGVNTYTRSEAQGVNYAVSVEDVKRFLSDPTPKPAPAAPSAPSAKASAKGSPSLPALRPGCQPRLGERRRDPDEPAWITPVDTDCDGRADAVLAEWDPQAKRGRLLALDTNGDGKPDVFFIDEQARGRWDYSLHDTDFDGKPDVRAIYEGGSLQPVRIVQQR